MWTKSRIAEFSGNVNSAHRVYHMSKLHQTMLLIMFVGTPREYNFTLLCSGTEQGGEGLKYSTPTVRNPFTDTKQREPGQDI